MHNTVKRNIAHLFAYLTTDISHDCVLVFLLCATYGVLLTSEPFIKSEEYII